MASPNRPARLNRTLLVITAIVLLVVAAFVAVTALGVLPFVSRDGTVLPANLALPSWAAWIGAVAGVVVGLLALRWLLAQTIRRPATSVWRYRDGTLPGRTEIDAKDAVGPLTDEIEELPGVHRAQAWLSGTRERPTLHLLVRTTDRAQIGDLRERIDQDVLPRFRAALELTDLPADLLLHLDDTATARTA